MTDKTWRIVKDVFLVLIVAVCVLYVMQLQVQNATLSAKLNTSVMFQKLVQFEQFMIQEKEKQEALKNPPPVEVEPEPDTGQAPNIPHDVIDRLYDAGVPCDWRWKHES